MRCLLYQFVEIQLPLHLSHPLLSALLSLSTLRHHLIRDLLPLLRNHILIHKYKLAVAALSMIVVVQIFVAILNILYVLLVHSACLILLLVQVVHVLIILVGIQLFLQLESSSSFLKFLKTVFSRGLIPQYELHFFQWLQTRAIVVDEDRTTLPIWLLVTQLHGYWIWAVTAR